MNEIRKILLLTLGTGKISENREAGYRSVQYTIDGKDYKRNEEDIEGTKTNFVAEPIIDVEKPDEIYILGTVKSVWHQFYASAITENNEDMSYKNNPNYLRLIEIEQQYNVWTQKEKLQELSKEISAIFSSINSWSKYSEKYKHMQPRIHILLTRYGINKQELIENYDILKQIEYSLEQKYKYEISFDITHSFRSLPIYNLVILNYIKNITKYKIAIRHIYYGNIEASHELNGKAPIVDLYDLVHILDLTNGVAEFKDTGNSITLLKMLEEKDPLKEALEKFDFATQLNAFDKIKEELKNLCDLIAKESDDSRYTGVREMISTVLGEKFFGEEQNNISEISKISDTDLKFLLTKWFFNQNRTGLGLATGLEALRDITTPAFMKARGFSEGDERKYRENSEKYFIDVAKELEKKQQRTPMEQCSCSLGGSLSTYKNIRNTFAHSLKNNADANVNKYRDSIEEFRQQLFALKDMYDQAEGEFEELFKIKLEKDSNISRESIECIYVFGKKEIGESWQTILNMHTGLRQENISYAERQVCDEYLRHDQTVKERKMLRENMCTCLEKYMEDCGVDKSKLLVVLKSTEYIKQTEIIKEMSRKGYNCSLYVCPAGKEVGLRKIENVH